jgi:catechol 2,3-dioxygenase-like lactoylglutathione lyase family enzyme
MTIVISHTSIDCHDAFALSEWWRTALGYEMDPEDPNFPGHEECAIHDPESGHTLLFLEVPDEELPAKRIHFDVRPRGRVAAGARRRTRRGPSRDPRTRQRLGHPRRPGGQSVLRAALAGRARGLPGHEVRGDGGSRGTDPQPGEGPDPDLVPELLVEDLARSLAFWRGACGFTVRYDRPEEGFAYLVRGSAHVMLEERGRGRNWVTGELAPPYGRGLNLQIAVPDLDPLLAALRTASVPLFMEPETRWYRIGRDEEAGVRQALVQDPDGYLLRFQQSLGRRRPTQEDEAESRPSG